MTDQENPQSSAPPAAPSAEQPAAPAPSPGPGQGRSSGPGRGSGGGGGRGPGGGSRGPERGRPGAGAAYGRGREGGPPGGAGRKGKRQYFRKKKVCRFCVDKVDFIDYKRVDMLQPFVQERGKLMPRRLTGTCSRHQRWLNEAIKRARNIALLPFATEL